MLSVEHLTKIYEPPRGFLRFLMRAAITEPVRALEDVSFEVGRGSIAGLVGPNGAGKTTLIKSMTTLLAPTEGRVRLDGCEVSTSSRDVRMRFGLVLTDERNHYWRLTGRQNLEYFGALYGLTRPQARARAGELLEQRGLAHRDQLVFGYSAGMRAQLAIARALLHEPAVLVLDEPTRSLDPVASAELCASLREMAADGRTVFMASHRLDEVQRICDRVLVLTAGRLRFEGSPDELAGAAGLQSSLLEMLAVDPPLETDDPPGEGDRAEPRRL